MNQMRGFSLGVIISALIFLFYLYPTVKDSWHKQGFNTGSISAKFEIANTLRDEFGSATGVKGMKLLFSVKTTSVYVIEQDGRKIVKVVD